VHARMVHASVHMEYISMRSWTIGHGSIFDLPLRTIPAGHHPQPDLPRLPYQNCGEGDHQVGSLASPGETSRHSSHQSQEIQDSWKKHQNKSEHPSGATMRTYLFPALFTTFKVGCRVEAFLRRYSCPPYSHLAFQSKQTLQPTSPPVRFDSNSFLIGVDNHASRCMANDTHLFEDLRLNKNNGHVDGIADGLAIKGKGTFKFDIIDNDGKKHTIRIKNSFYIPKMRRCLLSPQHWAQEAKDGETWMQFKREFPYNCVLNWKGGKKTIPNQPSFNVPAFYTASSSLRYHAFAATFEATEASFFQREQVLQYPGQCNQMDDIQPEEFIAEENLNYKEKETSEDEGVSEDNKTIKTLNVPSPATAEEPPSEAIRSGPLTFDPRPLEEEDEHTTLATSDNQAELMQWHYCLGHLPLFRERVVQ
jgi:hypothetical protein